MWIYNAKRQFLLSLSLSRFIHCIITHPEFPIAIIAESRIWTNSSMAIRIYAAPARISRDFNTVKTTNHLTPDSVARFLALLMSLEILARVWYEKRDKERAVLIKLGDAFNRSRTRVASSQNSHGADITAIVVAFHRRV